MTEWLVCTVETESELAVSSEGNGLDQGKAQP